MRAGRSVNTSHKHYVYVYLIREHIFFIYGTRRSAADSWYW